MRNHADNCFARNPGQPPPSSVAQSPEPISTRTFGNFAITCSLWENCAPYRSLTFHELPPLHPRLVVLRLEGLSLSCQYRTVWTHCNLLFTPEDGGSAVLLWPRLLHLYLWFSWAYVKEKSCWISSSKQGQFSRCLFCKTVSSMQIFYLLTKAFFWYFVVNIYYTLIHIFFLFILISLKKIKTLYFLIL